MGAYSDKKNDLPIGETEKTSIKNKSPQRAMPLNPTAQGWSGAQIRAQLLRAVLDDENSVLAILEGRFLDLKDILEDLYDMVLLESFDGLSPKETLVDEDVIAINDSEDADAIKKTTLSSVKSFIENYVDGLLGDLEEDIDSKIDKDISEYPTASLADGQFIYVRDGSVSKKATIGDIKTHIAEGFVAFSAVIVSADESGLPDVDSPLGNKMYLVDISEPGEDNLYEEYIYIAGAWELIGTTRVNLEAYNNSLEWSEV
jgi:hypothetical protein